jgi:ubiquinone/menaquinone biosynthesis C-methylase UbiE
MKIVDIINRFIVLVLVVCLVSQGSFATTSYPAPEAKWGILNVSAQTFSVEALATVLLSGHWKQMLVQWPRGQYSYQKYRLQKVKLKVPLNIFSVSLANLSSAPAVTFGLNDWGQRRSILKNLPALFSAVLTLLLLWFIPSSWVWHKIIKEITPSFFEKLLSWNSPAAFLGMVLTTGNLRRRVARLASSQHTYKNPQNQILFTEALKLKNVVGDVAVEVGASFNYGPALALKAAGFSRILRIDYEFNNFHHARPHDDDNIQSLSGEATALDLDDNSIDLMIYNQSLRFIELDTQGTFKAHAVSAALREAFRVLKPGGWIFIKPGNYLSFSDQRDYEVGRVLKFLHIFTFFDIDILKIKASRVRFTKLYDYLSGEIKKSQKIEIPVFIFARKPFLVPCENPLSVSA